MQPIPLISLSVSVATVALNWSENRRLAIIFVIYRHGQIHLSTLSSFSSHFSFLSSYLPIRCLNFEEGANDGAFGGGIVGAPGDRLRKSTFDPREVSDFRPHVFQMVLGYGLNFGAGLRPVIDQSQQPANFFQSEAKIAGTHNEFQPFDMGIIIASVEGSGCWSARVTTTSGVTQRE